MLSYPQVCAAEQQGACVRNLNTCLPEVRHVCPESRVSSALFCGVRGCAHAAPAAAAPKAAAVLALAPAAVAAAYATRCATTAVIGRAGTASGGAPGTATGVTADGSCVWSRSDW